MKATFNVASHFENRAPEVRAVYDRILRAARSFGGFEEDPKKTSIHLVRKTAFAGIATRKSAVILTLKSNADIKSPRVVKREKVSANRWHCEVRLEKPSEVDAEVKRWLKTAYELSS
jgi:hypothetical protein